MEEKTTTQSNETLSIPEAISLVQTKLGRIPYTLETETTVGLPIRDCVVMLEKIRTAFVEASKKDVKEDAGK